MADTKPNGADCFSLLLPRRMDCDAPSVYAEAFFCHKLVPRAKA
jgi:hypothetical protein